MKSITITFFLASVIFSPTWAQQQDSTLLDEIVIAENRIQLPYAEQTRSISLLTRTQLKQTPALSVAEALHQVSGVDVRTRGAHGIQADVGIRGGTFDQTLILVNGIKISDPQTGHHSLNLPVNLAQVERIEVLKGPGARTFGQNAFAGAINIVTAQPEKTYARVGVQGGDFKLWGLKGEIGLVKENQWHNLAVNFDQSAGYKYNTDYSLFNAFYNGQVQLKNGTLELLGGYTDRAFGANGFYASPAYTEQFETIQTGLATISYSRQLNTVQLTARAYYRQNDDEYIFIRNNPSVYQNNHTNKTLGVELNTVIPHSNATTGLGVDVNKVTLSSNNLGERRRTVATFYAEHRMEYFQKKLAITPGVQVNYYSDFGTNVLPGVDAGYRLGAHATLFGNIGYTYRVPTFTDLYYTDPVNAGNPNLQPEYAWNYELGIKTHRLKNLQAEAALFVRDGRNMIDWVRATDSDPWKPINVLALVMKGIDSQLTYRFNSNRNNPLQSFQLNYTYILANAQSQENMLSRYALENLKHQLRANVVLTYTKHLTHTISAAYYNRVNLDDYTIVDTRLSYNATAWSIFADVTNIFDVTYQETNLVTMPGRWFKAGVTIKLF